jgi:phosphopantetheinyl transferase
MARVIVLHARLDPGPVERNPVNGTDFRPSGVETLAALLEQLPYAKRLELERRDRAARHASLDGIGLALAGATSIRGRPFAPAELRFPMDGKPYFAGGPRFSISHASTRVAVALSDDIDVGIDLEDLGEPRPGGGDPHRRLARWTAVEAVLKAAGRGLKNANAVRLDEALATGTLDGATYRLTPLSIAPDVVAHLATPRGTEPPTVEISAAVVPG